MSCYASSDGNECLMLMLEDNTKICAHSSPTLRLDLTKAGRRIAVQAFHPSASQICTTCARLQPPLLYLPFEVSSSRHRNCSSRRMTLTSNHTRNSSSQRLLLQRFDTVPGALCKICTDTLMTMEGDKTPDGDLFYNRPFSKLARQHYKATRKRAKIDTGWIG